MNRRYISRPEREYRRNEMKKLRLEGKTLQEIADLFDTCRQQVTYLIGKTGRDFRRHFTEGLVSQTDLSKLTTGGAQRERNWKMNKKTLVFDLFVYFALAAFIGYVIWLWI
jgi:hypothetical protein